MAVVAIFGFEVLSSFTGDSLIATLISFVISGGLSVVAYLLTLISLGGISKDDIKSMPKGEKIVALFVKMKLMKKD